MTIGCTSSPITNMAGVLHNPLHLIPSYVSDVVSLPSLEVTTERGVPCQVNVLKFWTLFFATGDSCRERTDDRSACLGF